MKNKSLATLLPLAAALCGAPAFAADDRLPVPDQGWEVRFDGPAYDKVDEKNRPNQYMLRGTSGRFNVSLFVETPSCAGGLSNEALYACYQVALKRNPMVVPATVRANALPKGVAVMYMMQVEAEGRKIPMFNINVLFAHGGKQGDLHVSMIAPQHGDVEALIRIAESFDVVDTAAAPAPAGSAAN